MKNFLLFTCIVASGFCTVASYLMELPLFITIFIEVAGVIYIWYMITHSKFNFMTIDEAFVIIPTLVIEHEDESFNIVWLKWGLYITEKNTD